MAEGFLKELGKVRVRPPLYSGSQSTIDFANKPVYHDKTKHIDVRYHFIHKLLKDSVFCHLKRCTQVKILQTC